MNINTAPKSGLLCLHNQKILILFSLLFTISLFSSCFVSTFNDISPLALGTPDKIVVSNESELRNAISSARGPTIISLDNDITLTTTTLAIYANKDITLTSTATNNFYKLFGANGSSTLTVMYGGTLRLDSIIVTHDRGVKGSGISVNAGGTLFMTNGEISGNDNYLGGLGGGVYINGSGSFEMSGGKISRNVALYGGGIDNFCGNFSMSGGEIFENTANWGGGVLCSVNGVFEMSGGKISCNTTPCPGYTGNVGYDGGGVLNEGTFCMSGGEISGNIVQGSGGGVHNVGVFIMLGGTIFGNKVSHNGGGVANRGNFTMYAGEISDNIAVNNIYTYFGNGGGVAVYGVFRLSGGKISGNNATVSGGGIWVAAENLGNLFVSDGVVFSGNCASESVSARRSEHDAVYAEQIGSNVVWTVPFTQGYNNYDISYTNDALTGPEPSGDGERSGGDLQVLIMFAVVLIAIVVVGGLVFYFKKK